MANVEVSTDSLFAKIGQLYMEVQARAANETRLENENHQLRTALVQATTPKDDPSAPIPLTAQQLHGVDDAGLLKKKGRGR